jgi:hypothetical protein
MEEVQEERVEDNPKGVWTPSCHNEIGSFVIGSSPLKVSGPTTDIMFLPLLLFLITSLLLDSKHAIHMLQFKSIHFEVVAISLMIYGASMNISFTTKVKILFLLKWP